MFIQRWFKVKLHCMSSRIQQINMNSCWANYTARTYSMLHSKAKELIHRMPPLEWPVHKSNTLNYLYINVIILKCNGSLWDNIPHY